MGTGHLTERQRADYERDGYLVLPSLYTAGELAEMREEADRLIELTVNASIATGEVSPRLDVQLRDGRFMLRKIQPINDVSEVFARYSSDERYIGPLREILGCEPVLMEEKLNYKQLLDPAPPIPAGTDGEAFDYHTDWAYFCLEGYPRETLSSAISVDDSTPDNGPLRVLPGSHRRDWPLRGGWPPIIADDVVPEDEVVDILAPAGSVMLFHSCLVHNSRSNTTDEPRRIMIFSHHPSTHDIEPDKRNAPLRERSREHERRYREAATAGAYEDAFRLRGT